MNRSLLRRSVRGLLVTAIFLLSKGTGRATDINLVWDASPDKTVAGYRLKWGTQKGLYNSTQTVGLNLKGTVKNLLPNSTYYFTVTAYNASGYEGDLSDALVFVTPRVNRKPVSEGQFLSVAEDQAVAMVLRASDPDDNPVTFSVVSKPASGTLSGSAPNLVYTPASNFFGTDSFKFVASDSALTSDPATVTITVTPVNDRPVAASRSVNLPASGQAAVTLSGSDVESGALTYRIVRSPAKGRLTGTAPNLNYIADTSFPGSDTFTYVVNDGVCDSATATITIVGRPSTQADRIVVSQGSHACRLASGAASVLDNDSARDLRVTLVRSTTRGQLSLATDGTFNYWHSGGPDTTDSFVYRADRDGVASPETTVTISIFRITSVTSGATSLAIGFNTLTGGVYEIQSSPTPGPNSEWNRVGVPRTATAGTMLVDCPVGTGSAFFRVVFPNGPSTLVSDTVGSIPVSVRGGLTALGSPFITLPSFVSRVASAAASSISFAGLPFTDGQFATRDGIEQFVVMVRAVVPGSPAKPGDWWTISGNDTSNLIVNSRSANLSNLIAAGDTVEIRSLVKVSNLLGAPLAEGSILAPGDSLMLMNDPDRTTYALMQGPNFSRPGYAFRSPLGTMGNANGSTLAILPGSGVRLTRAGSDITVRMAGRVQPTGLTFYISHPEEFLSIPSPVEMTLNDTGLVGCGWRGASSLAGVGSADLLWLLSSANSNDRVWFLNGNNPTWMISTRSATSLNLPPGNAMWIDFANRPSPLTWRLPASWLGN